MRMLRLTASVGTRHIDSGVFRQFISDIRLLTSWGDDAANVTFNNAAGMPISSRAVIALDFVANGDQFHVRKSMQQAYYAIRLSIVGVFV